MTTLEKITLYENMVQTLEFEHDIGFFCGLCRAFEGNTNHSMRKMTEILPELKKFEPEPPFLYWFSITLEGVQQRIGILKEIIADLKATL